MQSIIESSKKWNTCNKKWWNIYQECKIPTWTELWSTYSVFPRFWYCVLFRIDTSLSGIIANSGIILPRSNTKVNTPSEYGQCAFCNNILQSEIYLWVPLAWCLTPRMTASVEKTQTLLLWLLSSARGGLKKTFSLDSQRFLCPKVWEDFGCSVGSGEIFTHVTEKHRDAGGLP